MRRVVVFVGKFTTEQSWLISFLLASVYCSVWISCCCFVFFCFCDHTYESNNIFLLNHFRLRVNKHFPFDHVVFPHGDLRQMEIGNIYLLSASSASGKQEVLNLSFRSTLQPSFNP